MLEIENIKIFQDYFLLIFGSLSLVRVLNTCLAYLLGKPALLDPFLQGELGLLLCVIPAHLFDHLHYSDQLHTHCLPQPNGHFIRAGTDVHSLSS